MAEQRLARVPISCLELQTHVSCCWRLRLRLRVRLRRPNCSPGLLILILILICSTSPTNSPSASGRSAQGQRPKAKGKERKRAANVTHLRQAFGAAGGRVSTTDGTDAPRDHLTGLIRRLHRAPVLSNPLVVRRQMLWSHNSLSTPVEALENGQTTPTIGQQPRASYSDHQSRSWHGPRITPATLLPLTRHG